MTLKSVHTVVSVWTPHLLSVSWRDINQVWGKQATPTLLFLHNVSLCCWTLIKLSKKKKKKKCAQKCWLKPVWSQWWLEASRFLGRASHSHDISGNPQENFNWNLARISTWTRGPSSYFSVCASSTSFLYFLVPPTWDAGIGGKEQKQGGKIGGFKQDEASVLRSRNLKQPSVKCFCVTAASSVLCLVSSLLLHFVISVRWAKQLMYLVLMQFITCHKEKNEQYEGEMTFRNAGGRAPHEFDHTSFMSQLLKKTLLTDPRL